MVHPSDTSAGDPCRSLSDRELRTQMIKALSQLRAMYDAGTPFFIKETIRDVCQQLKKIFHEEGRRNKSTKELLGTPLRPYEEVANHFKASREAWKASDTCKQLGSRLLSAKTPSEITKVIGLACGPATDADQSLAERSLFQHALLLTVRDVLNVKKGTVDRITCYAQDPAYTDIDKLVLKESGIIVLDHPEAFLEVDDSTVVFSYAADAPVREIVSDVARPAVMIWDDVKDDGPIEIDGELVPRCVLQKADPVSPRLRGMARDMYDEYGFPDDREHFGNLAIYVIRTATTSTDQNPDDIQLLTQIREEGLR